MPLRDLGSGSELHRRLSCEASAVLPRVDTEGTPWASRGSAIHAFLEDVNASGREEALERVPTEYRALCEAIDLSRLNLSRESVASEVALAYDTATGAARELGRNLGRRYREAGLRIGEEIPCTIDLGALVGADAVFVGDFKTGWSHSIHTPAAARSPQLALGALALCRIHGRSRAIVEIIRVFDDGGIWKDQAVLDAFALAEFEGRLVEMVDRDRANADAFERGVMPRATSGDWCGYCKSRCYCPAVTGLVRQFGAAPADAASEVVALITPENAAEARRRLKLAKKALQDVEDALEAFARETPVDMGEGVIYGPCPKPRDEIDGKVAQRALTSEFDPDFARIACDLDCTKSGIERAVRKYLGDHPAENKRGALGALKDRAIAALERAGGIKHVTTKVVTEWRPKTDKREAA